MTTSKVDGKRPELASDLVFLDTQVFRSAHFNFSEMALHRFADVCAMGDLKLLTTEITNREVEAALRETAAEIYQALQRFRGRVHVFDRLDGTIGGKPYQSVGLDDVRDALRAKLDDFLQEGRAQVVILPEGVLGHVLDRYFNQQAPFSSKKKSEFPDAFVLNALEAYAEHAGAKVYVVSDDGDLKEYCAKSQRLVWIKSVGELVDIYHYHMDKLSKEFLASVSERRDEIKSAIKEKIEHSGFYVDDEDGEVVEARVREIETKNYLFLDLSPRHASIGVEYEATVIAEVVYKDSSRGAWDSEEHEWLYRPEVTVEVPVDIETTAEFVISMEVDGSTIQSLSLEDAGVGTDIAVSVSDAAEGLT